MEGFQFILKLKNEIHLMLFLSTIMREKSHCRRF
jgi:hypothetical protein